MLRFHPMARPLASGGEDNVIYLWDLKTNQEKARLEGHQGHVSGLAFTPDGAELVSCSYDGSVRVWDWRRGQETRRFADGQGWHYLLDLAPDGKTLVLATGQLWNIATGEQIGAVPNYQGLQNRAVFSPDGKRLAAGGRKAAVVEIASGKEICCFTGHQAKQGDPRVKGVRVNCVAFSPDGRRAASGGGEGVAYIWDASTGKMLSRLEGHENPIIDIVFSPDGRNVATANGSMWNHKEQTVRLWETLTGKERRRFVGHHAQVTSIVFSSDTQRIISGSEDGTALVWDATGVLKPQTVKATAEKLWEDMEGEDAVAAYEAVCALAGRQEVAFLSKRLCPADGPDSAKPGLRKALESASLEVRRRAETLLAKLDTSPPSPKIIQALRAVEALERIATPAAQDLLQKLANGAPEARLTREVKASIDRLSNRQAGR